MEKTSVLREQVPKPREGETLAATGACADVRMLNEQSRTASAPIKGFRKNVILMSPPEERHSIETPAAPIVQSEGDGYGGQNLHGLAVEQCRSITPLLDRFNGSRGKQRAGVCRTRKRSESMVPSRVITASKMTFPCVCVTTANLG
jgi:hypothetical protein